MDFFGDLTGFLDEIIPESDDVGSLFDTAIDALGSNKGGSSTVYESSVKMPDIEEELDDLNSMALTEGLKQIERRQSQKPLESVDPRAIQAEWMQRLKTFTMDEEV